MKRALVVAALAGTAATGATLAVVTTQVASDSTASGTTVGGLPAGGLDREALEALLTRTREALPSRLTVVLGPRRSTIATDRLGLQLDVPATAERVLTDSGTGRWWGLLGRRSGRDVAPVLARDGAALDATVAALVRSAVVRESHGDFAFTAGRLVTVAPSDGQHVDAASVVTALEGLTRRLPWAGTVTVPVVPEPVHTTAAQLEDLAVQARALLESPLTLRAAARETAVPTRDLGGQLTVVAEGDTAGHEVTVGLRTSAAEVLAEPAARRLSVAPVEPRVDVPSPEPLLREKGSVRWTPVPVRSTLAAKGVPGQRVEAPAVLEALRKVVRAAGRAVVVPAQVQQPKSSDAAAARIDAVLGTFTTAFACCQPRVSNIALMARTVNGTLIAPGQSFSLNGIVGPRTREKGYVEAPFILDGELSTDVGGGVSQFATTTLNAAFFAGLKLDRHQPHSFYISRYPAGREATVNYPTIDLRWTNDTSTPVLVRTVTTGTSVTVALYGRGDGRTVSAETGPRTPVAGRDFRIVVTRVVSLPGAPVRRQSFTTTYNTPPEHD